MRRRRNRTGAQRRQWAAALIIAAALLMCGFLVFRVTLREKNSGFGAAGADDAPGYVALSHLEVVESQVPVYGAGEQVIGHYTALRSPHNAKLGRTLARINRKAQEWVAAQQVPGCQVSVVTGRVDSHVLSFRQILYVAGRPVAVHAWNLNPQDGSSLPLSAVVDSEETMADLMATKAAAKKDADALRAARLDVLMRSKEERENLTWMLTDDGIIFYVAGGNTNSEKLKIFYDEKEKLFVDYYRDIPPTYIARVESGSYVQCRLPNKDAAYLLFDREGDQASLSYNGNSVALPILPRMQAWVARAGAKNWYFYLTATDQSGQTWMQILDLSDGSIRDGGISPWSIAREGSLPGQVPGTGDRVTLYNSRVTSVMGTAVYREAELSRKSALPAAVDHELGLLSPERRYLTKKSRFLLYEQKEKGDFWPGQGFGALTQQEDGKYLLARTGDGRVAKLFLKQKNGRLYVLRGKKYVRADRLFVSLDTWREMSEKDEKN